MQELRPCPLWGSGTLIKRSLDNYEIENPRSGGRYRISGSATAILANKRTDELAAKLSSWILEQHRNGAISPLINSNVLEVVQQRPRLAISQQVRQFFLLLLNRRFRAASFLANGGTPDAGHENDMTDMLAWMECVDDLEQSAIIKLLVQDQMIQTYGNRITLTSAGVRKLEETERSQILSKQAFVAMWFNQSMEEAFEGIKKAIEQTGYRALRIDKKEHINKIDDEIVAEIRRSRFVVADFTCDVLNPDHGRQAVARGGVYFEAGFAMGLGIPVIWCCREDLINDVHFDTRQFAHVVWKDAAELETHLKNRIRAVIVEHE